MDTPSWNTPSSNYIELGTKQLIYVRNGTRNTKPKLNQNIGYTEGISSVWNGFC